VFSPQRDRPSLFTIPGADACSPRLDCASRSDPTTRSRCFTLLVFRDAATLPRSIASVVRRGSDHMQVGQCSPCYSPCSHPPLLPRANRSGYPKKCHLPFLPHSWQTRGVSPTSWSFSIKPCSRIRLGYVSQELVVVLAKFIPPLTFMTLFPCAHSIRTLAMSGFQPQPFLEADDGRLKTPPIRELPSSFVITAKIAPPS